MTCFLPNWRKWEEPSTLACVNQFLVWIFQVLSSGLTPSHDFAGRAIAGGNEPIGNGLRFAFSGIKADWKARVEMLGLWRAWNCSNICEQCLASTDSDFYYGDFAADARYAHMFSQSDYLQLCKDCSKPVPVLARIPGFSPLRSTWDSMHVLWHAGVGSDLGAGLAWLFCSSDVFPGGTLDQQLEHGCQLFSAWASKTPGLSPNAFKPWCATRLRIAPESAANCQL